MDNISVNQENFHSSHPENQLRDSEQQVQVFATEISRSAIFTRGLSLTGAALIAWQAAIHVNSNDEYERYYQVAAGIVTGSITYPLFAGVLEQATNVANRIHDSFRPQSNEISQIEEIALTSLQVPQSQYSSEATQSQPSSEIPVETL